ncbi:MAG: hypothetical protein ACLPN5_15360 [Roseiarcus sp.]
MIYREIVHTCSHSGVAGAAVVSIGGEFARAFAAEAARRNLAPGQFAAQKVSQFAAGASEVEMCLVSAAADKSDLPLLSGLRYILESG